MRELVIAGKLLLYIISIPLIATVLHAQIKFLGGIIVDLSFLPGILRVFVNYSLLTISIIIGLFEIFLLITWLIYGITWIVR